LGIWIILLIGSAAIGVACAKMSPRWLSLLASGAVPWFTLLGALLVSDASMWEVAQLFGGTAAAIVGLVSCLFVRKRQSL
jgi:hypothetical protein